jgi:hypothetical protein
MRHFNLAVATLNNTNRLYSPRRLIDGGVFAGSVTAIGFRWLLTCERSKALYGPADAIPLFGVAHLGMIPTKRPPLGAWRAWARINRLVSLGPLPLYCVIYNEGV